MNRILSTKVQSRKELIEVVKEYRSAVERAKSQQSLKNYHRRFREQLKSKLSKTHEKQCEKISNTISQSLYSLHSFNIWPLLYSQRGSNLALSIPPTLYHDSKLEFFAFSHEHLEFFTGPNIYESFIQGLQIEASLPICVFKPLDGKLKLISTISNQPLIIDANEAYTNADDVISFMQQIHQYNIVLMEQPMPASCVDDYIAVKKANLFPIMADESICDDADFDLLTEQFNCVNMKLMKAGGYLNGMRIINEARARGLKTMIGCMVETSLGINSALQLCANVNYADLDGFLIVKKEPYQLVAET